MGSGCNQNSASNSRCFEVVSDQCVQYTGPEIPLLGICNKDRLDEVTAVLVAKILAILDELDMSTIDLNCAFVESQMVGKDKDIFTLIQVLIDSQCTLKEAVDTINEDLATSVSFDLKCITATTNDVNGTIQGLINKVCTMDADIQDIKDQLNNGTDISSTVNNLIGNFLHANVNTCSGYGVTKSGSGDSATISLYGQVPPFCPIPCFAPLSYFDSTGRGLDDGPFCGYFIYNGNNGTPDMRGYTFAGATSLPGIFAANALDNAVDPAVQGLPYGSSMFDKKGAVKETLTISQMPAHVHPVNDPGHVHTATLWGNSNSIGGVSGFQGIATTGTGVAQGVGYTDGSSNQYTNVTIASTGGGQAHNNIQPTIFGYWIGRSL